MKLEEGMYYTRTNDGKLGLCKCGNLTPKEYVDTYKDIYNIKNASHNIIDLIEVGDYVNGNRVKQITETYIEVDYYGSDFYREEDIKSIVTKEQFESMSYKVGE